MTPEQAKALREPFAPELIGKLPRVWCGECRNSRSKVCDKHSRAKCRDCGGNLTTAHLHLDYVGHAEITDRLLSVDPEWAWEPVAFDPATGLPRLDPSGGLWIRLTIAGVTRLGYGHADGKTGPDAIKESIGDALRNAAMRFGVALDLWGAKFKEQEDDAVSPELGPVVEVVAEQVRTETTRMVEQAQHRKMHALWRELGYDGDAFRQARLDATSKIVGHPVESSASLTYAEAEQVIAAQQAKKRHAARPRETAGASA